jgi:nicotinate-nucleotide adenylyltransferase
VLGGSFDPPHIGHVVLAQEALSQLPVDEVRLVPCNRSPHKPEGHHFAPERRLAMAVAAVRGHRGLAVSRAELDRPPPSYTVDTLEAVAAERPARAVWLVIGADQVASLPRWRRPERLLELARLAVVERPGMGADDLVLEAAGLDAGRVNRIAIPRIDVSSTEIRRRLAAGQPVWHLVPAGVEPLLAPDGPG